MAKFLHFLSFFVIRIIFKLFVNFRVYGKENLLRVNRLTVFITEHESNFVPYLISSGLPWSSLFHPIFRISGKSIFDSLSLRGFSRLPITSINTQPIIPVFIFGIEGLSWKKIFLRRKEVAIHYGKPFTIKDDLSEKELSKEIQNALKYTRASMLKAIDEGERKFWANYGKLYHHIEEVKPYRDLLEAIGNEIGITHGLWLDLGSGSGAVIDLLKKQVNSRESTIIGSDFDPSFICKLKQRFKEDSNIEIKEINLTQKIPFEDNKFDGITANLVLSYIIHHQEEVNTEAYQSLLSDIFRILKCGGKFVWSSPKKGVQFFKVFLASREKVFGFDNKEQIFYGPVLLRQALTIQNKGRKDVYHFLDTDELNRILLEIGFTEIRFIKSMAGQVNVISCVKPL